MYKEDASTSKENELDCSQQDILDFNFRSSYFRLQQDDFQNLASTLRISRNPHMQKLLPKLVEVVPGHIRDFLGGSPCIDDVRVVSTFRVSL